MGTTQELAMVKGCFKLFGVNIMTKERHDEAIRRTSSMGLLESRTNNVEEHARHAAAAAGYLSDGLVQYERGDQLAHERKKGQQWSDEEHSSFLVGLDKLGKGNWKSISKEYVPTRTPSQVASHAQKYYQRQLPASENKKRRTSMFDKPLVKPDTTQTAAAYPPLSRSAEGPQVLPIYPTYGVQGIPYIVGVPGNGQRFPAGRIAPNVPFVPMMNAIRPPYVYLPRAFGNFAAWAPISSRLSGVPSPSNLPNQGASTIERGFLDGRMASPLDPQLPESSQTSGAIRVT